MSLQSKSLADLTSEQTSASDTDVLFIESAGTPAKITVANLLSGLQALIDAIPDVLDEDDMASDSATQPPSQQSTKAYIDGQTAITPSDDVSIGLRMAGYARIGNGTSGGFAVDYQAGFSNIARSGSGAYTFTFTTARDDAEYLVEPSAVIGNAARSYAITAATDTGFTIETLRSTDGGNADTAFGVIVYEPSS